jgi:hypothetical protein
MGISLLIERMAVALQSAGRGPVTTTAGHRAVGLTEEAVFQQLAAALAAAVQ